MEKELLEKKVAELEFYNDQLLTELRYVDDLLMSVGFTNGLDTVKKVALELISDQVGQQEEC